VCNEPLTSLLCWPVGTCWDPTKAPPARRTKQQQQQRSLRLWQLSTLCKPTTCRWVCREVKYYPPNS
jgi:hypothetical protein